MESWAAAHRRGAHGTHEYAIEDFGHEESVHPISAWRGRRRVNSRVGEPPDRTGSVLAGKLIGQVEYLTEFPASADGSASHVKDIGRGLQGGQMPVDTLKATPHGVQREVGCAGLAPR